VTSDDIVLGADQARVRKAELADGSRDVCNLIPAVRAWIVNPRNQAFNRPTLDLNVDLQRERLSGVAVDALCHLK
jgi:hypothetical protein